MITQTEKSWVVIHERWPEAEIPAPQDEPHSDQGPQGHQTGQGKEPRRSWTNIGSPAAVRVRVHPSQGKEGQEAGYIQTPPSSQRRRSALSPGKGNHPGKHLLEHRGMCSLPRRSASSTTAGPCLACCDGGSPGDDAPGVEGGAPPTPPHAGTPPRTRSGRGSALCLPPATGSADPARAPLEQGAGGACMLGARLVTVGEQVPLYAKVRATLMRGPGRTGRTR